MRRILFSIGFLAVLPVAGFGASLVADAAMNRDLAGLKTAIVQKADVKAAQADGSTALHWAAHWDNLEAADLLLKAGADPNAATRLGATPLYLAAENGNAAMLKKLLAAGADPNKTVLMHGETPVMFAARSGGVEAVKALLDAGANVNVKETYQDTTALHWAAEQNHPEVVALLLARGASADAASKVIRPAPARAARRPVPAKPVAASAASGATSGAAAQAPGEAQVVSSLVPPAQTAAAPAPRNASAGASAANGGSAQAADNTDDDPDGPPPPAAHGGLTPLVLATREHGIDSVRALLDGKAPIDQQTGDGSTALVVATQNGFADIAKLLIERGADVNISNAKGWNPLFLAVKARTMETGTMPNQPLDTAALLEIIHLLVEHGANVNARLKVNSEVHNAIFAMWLREPGATPFLRAAMCGDLEVMKYLLAHGADPKINTNDGTTALMVAAGVGYADGFSHDFGGQEQTLEAMKLLIDLGVDVNAKNSDGIIALHGAAHKSFLAAIQLLVDHGADLSVRSHRVSQFESRGNLGNTALDWATGVQTSMQSAIYHPEAVALIKKLMTERGIPIEGLSQTKGGSATAVKY